MKQWGEGMYEVMLAVKSKALRKELKDLRIWGEPTGFHISKITEDFENLIPDLRENKYDLVLLEHFHDNHVLSLISKIKNENLCRAVAVVCEYVDFKIVRKSFLLGADDFFVIPLENSQFISLFSKIENDDQKKVVEEICQREELFSLFESVDFSIRERLDELSYQIMTRAKNQLEAVSYMERVLDSIVLELFEKYPWLALYFDKEEYISSNYEAKTEEGIKKGVEKFYSLFVEFSELYPRHGKGLEDILQYILNNPEGDLKQKTISEELHINRSYLSTVFTAQIEMNFVEYVNTVKMKRAAWLLLHTKMKVIDIAGVLDYKDMGYFLKRFKAKYNFTPSQYRIPEAYEFQI